MFRWQGCRTGLRKVEIQPQCGTLSGQRHTAFLHVSGKQEQEIIIISVFVLIATIIATGCSRHDSVELFLNDNLARGGETSVNACGGDQGLSHSDSRHNAVSDRRDLRLGGHPFDFLVRRVGRSELHGDLLRLADYHLNLGRRDGNVLNVLYHSNLAGCLEASVGGGGGDHCLTRSDSGHNIILNGCDRRIT